MNRFIRRLLTGSKPDAADDNTTKQATDVQAPQQEAASSPDEALSTDNTPAADSDSAYAPSDSSGPSGPSTNTDDATQTANTNGAASSSEAGQHDSQDSADRQSASYDVGTDIGDIGSARTAPLPAGVTRPLPSEPVNIYQPHSGHLIFGQSSDQGMVRNNNQDAAISFFFTSATADKYPDFGLFVVADGMGGHDDGEKASAMTARIVASKVLSDLYLPMVEQRYENSADQPTISEALSDAVKKANRTVLSDVPRAGTTVTAIVVLGSMAHIAHVGDSRAYLLNGDKLEQITRDHSLVQRLIELNQITYEESLEHPQRNVLYRAVGQNPDLEVDTLTRRLPAGSHMLICSDGLWGLLGEKDILDVLKQFPDPQEACNKLVAQANENGGHDNITAVLIKIPSQ